uniref:Uncharacterized protein n=1 Tax=Periophthalmus magnuspinnatus TaxID=409849 RepID=A0A3B4BJT9_9GOBI
MFSFCPHYPTHYSRGWQHILNCSTLMKKAIISCSCRHFWGWLNAVFNKVDHERIKAVGPDRAAAEWLLRCGAKVRFQGFDRFHQDYNALPTGPLGRYRIQAIDATESCIMHKGFGHLDGLKNLEEIRFKKCIYIEDGCLEQLSSIENLQNSVYLMEVVSCGNVTDKGIIALQIERNEAVHISLVGVGQRHARFYVPDEYQST